MTKNLYARSSIDVREAFTTCTFTPTKNEVPAPVGNTMRGKRNQDQGSC
jgi:hypothetical protein